jgi:hypothetical protein
VAKIILLSFILALFSFGSLSAQPVLDYSNIEYIVAGAENATASVINDSFAPMTHYTEKNWTARFVPAVFRLDRAYDDPEIEGDDFHGWGAGAGAGYALSDQLMAYGIIGRTDAQGDLNGDFYGDAFGEQTVSLSFSTSYITTGMGYDFIKGKKKLSIPLYAGLYVQHYDADIDLPKATDPFSGITYDGTLSGKGYLYGFSGGLAVSYRLADKMKVTPYYLFSTSFNESEFDAEIENSLSSTKTNEEIEPGKLTTQMLGLNISYDTSESLSFSLGIGGLLTSQFESYSKNYQDGLIISTIVIVVSYKGGGY